METAYLSSTVLYLEAYNMKLMLSRHIKVAIL